jgi:hypothetical protein
MTAATLNVVAAVDFLDERRALRAIFGATGAFVVI